MNDADSYLFHIKIDRLHVDCYIGWYDWEHKAPQPIYVTIECDYLACSSVANDNLNATLDYDGLKDIVLNILKESQYKLLEAALVSIKKTLMEVYPAIKNLQVTLEKPNAIAGARAAILSL